VRGYVAKAEEQTVCCAALGGVFVATWWLLIVNRGKAVLRTGDREARAGRGYSGALRS